MPEARSKQFFTYPPNSSVDQIVLLVYKWKDCISERVSNLSKITQPVTGRFHKWTIFAWRAQERPFKELRSYASCSAPLLLCFWLLKSIRSSEMTTSGIHFHQTDGNFLEGKTKNNLMIHFGFESLQVSGASLKPSEGCRRSLVRTQSSKITEPWVKSALRHLLSACLHYFFLSEALCLPLFSPHKRTLGGLRLLS